MLNLKNSLNSPYNLIIFISLSIQFSCANNFTKNLKRKATKSEFYFPERKKQKIEHISKEQPLPLSSYLKYKEKYITEIEKYGKICYDLAEIVYSFLVPDFDLLYNLKMPYLIEDLIKKKSNDKNDGLNKFLKFYYEIENECKSAEFNDLFPKRNIFKNDKNNLNILVIIDSIIGNVKYKDILYENIFENKYNIFNLLFASIKIAIAYRDSFYEIFSNEMIEKNLNFDEWGNGTERFDNKITEKIIEYFKIIERDRNYIFCEAIMKNYNLSLLYNNKDKNSNIPKLGCTVADIRDSLYLYYQILFNIMDEIFFKLKEENSSKITAYLKSLLLGLCITNPLSNMPENKMYKKLEDININDFTNL